MLPLLSYISNSVRNDKISRAVGITEPNANALNKKKKMLEACTNLLSQNATKKHLLLESYTSTFSSNSFETTACGHDIESAHAHTLRVRHGGKPKSNDHNKVA